MTKSVFQERNIKTPEYVFNILGEQHFGNEWSHLPLQILQQDKSKIKILKEKFRRNKYMAERIFKKFCDFLKDRNVSIYAPIKSWDEDPDCVDLNVWKCPHYRISRKEFFLIEQEIVDGMGMDISRRDFWIEMPNEVNPLSFKKVGRKPKHDRGYLKSILPEVVKTIDGKITERSLASAYKDFLKGENIDAPSKSWIGENLDAELKRIREMQ